MKSYLTLDCIPPVSLRSYEANKTKQTNNQSEQTDPRPQTDEYVYWGLTNT